MVYGNLEAMSFGYISQSMHVIIGYIKYKKIVENIEFSERRFARAWVLAIRVKFVPIRQVVIMRSGLFKIVFNIEDFLSFIVFISTKNGFKEIKAVSIPLKYALNNCKSKIMNIK